MKINENLETDPNSTAISLHDLFTNKEFRNAYLGLDTKKVDELLFSIGVDPDGGFQIVERLHRPLTGGGVINGSMVLYIERTDKEWINSGYASMDAVIRSTGDRDTKEVMRTMQDAYLSTEKVIEISRGR